MKHAIGYAIDRVKKGKYTCFRNRFITAEANELWDTLVADGYADKQTSQIGGICYYVTLDGLALLSEILDIQILPEVD